MLLAGSLLILALAPPTEETAAAEPDPSAEAQTEPAAPEVVHLETRVAASPAGNFSNLKGRFRIHLDGNVFTFQHQREWFENDHVPSDDIEDVSNSFGGAIGQYNVGLGVGYGITDGLVVGAKLGLGFNHNRRLDKNPDNIGPDQIDSNLTFLFRPYVEYAFIPGGRFRPFIFAHGGVAGGRSVQTDSDDTGAVINHTISPTLGGGGGLHIFIIPQVSIDVFGEVDHYFTLAKTAVEIDGVIDPDLGDPDYDRAIQTTEFGVLLGISLWFGGGS